MFGVWKLSPPQHETSAIPTSSDRMKMMLGGRVDAGGPAWANAILEAMELIPIPARPRAPACRNPRRERLDLSRIGMADLCVTKRPTGSGYSPAHRKRRRSL